MPLKRPTDGNYEWFGRNVMEWVLKNSKLFYSEEIEELFQIAHKNELVERVKYDPKIHGDIEDTEPGQEIWWFEKLLCLCGQDKRGNDYTHPGCPIHRGGRGF